MRRLEEAIERLERAVARLETARGMRGRDVALPEARVLAEREAENQRLKEIAGRVAARVDNALARIGQVLGGGD